MAASTVKNTGRVSARLLEVHRITPAEALSEADICYGVLAALSEADICYGVLALIHTYIILCPRRNNNVGNEMSVGCFA